ncbi:glycerol-3-phosphate acyltransferase [Candidatus Poribacteria bacterium]
MIPCVWIGIGLLLGALPFSLWLGRLILHEDIRQYGDGNPGAFNAWRAGGKLVGLPALLLDYLKGAAPVAMANFVSGVSGWWLVPVALSPVFGHAFSPFLRFRGGKAVAATFGIWTGLTLWEGPTVLGCLLGVSYSLQKVDGWSVILSMMGLLIYLQLRWSDPSILTIWLGNIIILTWKHRHDLGQRIRFRESILRTLRR